MKIACLIIGIGLLILSGIISVVCLTLPSMTNNRVSFQESMLGLIPAAIVFFAALIGTIMSAFFVMKARKSS